MKSGVTARARHAYPDQGIDAKPADMVNHPPHYTSGMARCPSCDHPLECIDVTRSMSFSAGNAIKYIWRAGLKGHALQDLKKAAWYIQDLIRAAERAK